MRKASSHIKNRHFGMLECGDVMVGTASATSCRGRDKPEDKASVLRMASKKMERMWILDGVLEPLMSLLLNHTMFELTYEARNLSLCLNQPDSLRVRSFPRDTA